MAFIRGALSRAREVFGKSEDRTPFVKSDELESDELSRNSEVNQQESNRQPKPWLQLARLSGTVCGIEFCYAAETAFVSPILLRIGIPQRFMTMVWCLSPLMGFLWMPILGSASDRCGSRLGRRRPFIILLSVGIIIGLILVPNGYRLGGATCGLEVVNSTNSTSCIENITPEPLDVLYGFSGFESGMESLYDNETTTILPIQTSEMPLPACRLIPTVAGHTCGIIFTVIGIMLLDFNCDACQSPARAYLIDVTQPEDHVRGLSMFSFMAGLGGSLGYMIGGIPWHESTGSDIVGAQIRFVFGLVLIIFVIALVLTVTAEKEKTLQEIFPEERKKKKKNVENDEEMELGILQPKKSYGTGEEKIKDKQDIEEASVVNISENETPQEIRENGFGEEKMLVEGTMGNEMTDTDRREESTDAENVSMTTYLLSIIRMPWSVRILCCTHLLGWMSLLCYSLYFTDFVGQAVYGGDPYAEPGTPERYAYAKGVRMGSYAMGLYSFTCAVCSFTLERMMAKVGKSNNVLFPLLANIPS